MVAAETLANILIFPLSAKRCWLFEFKDLSRNESNMQDMHRIQGDIKGNEQTPPKKTHIAPLDFPNHGLRWINLKVISDRCK